MHLVVRSNEDVLLNSDFKVAGLPAPPQKVRRALPAPPAAPEVPSSVPRSSAPAAPEIAPATPAADPVSKDRDKYRRQGYGYGYGYNGYSRNRVGPAARAVGRKVQDEATHWGTDWWSPPSALTPAMASASKVAGVDPGLPRHQWPDSFRNAWRDQQRKKRRKDRIGWGNFVNKLPLEYQEQARQDYYAEKQQQHQSGLATQERNRANQAIPETNQAIPETTAPGVSAPGVSAPGVSAPVPGEEGNQQSFPFAASVTVQDFLAKLRTGVNQFGNHFNITTIRPYNEAIQQALSAIKNLSQQSQISLEIEEQGNRLLQLFEQIKKPDQKDQLVNELGQLAKALAESSGYNNEGMASAAVFKGEILTATKGSPSSLVLG